MNKPVPYEINKQNLFSTCDILDQANIEYMVFYGTMLGLHRDGKIIENDDDVDLLVSVGDYDRILNVLKSYNMSISRNYHKMFLQIRNTILGVKSFVDIYFYYDTGRDYVVEPWNFSGLYKDRQNHIHIPRSLIFPLSQFDYDGKMIKTPYDTEGLCKFLYGDNYRVPLRKRIDYLTKIVDNKPQIIYNQIS